MIKVSSGRGEGQGIINWLLCVAVIGGPNCERPSIHFLDLTVSFRLASPRLISSRLVSSGSTPRLVVPDRSQFFLAVVNGPETLLGNSNFFYTQYQQYIPISLNHPEEGKNLDGRNTFKSATDLPLEARNFSTFLGFIGLPMVFAPVVPAVGGFFLMVAKDRRLEGGHHESTLLDPC